MKVDAANEPAEPERRDHARELAAGEVFGGAYRVVERIKAGGMGAIYEVVHLGTRRRRALKVLHPALVSDAAQRERFAHEATVTAEVKSEHLVEVFDAGIDAATGMHFLVMELLEGEDLGEILARRGRLEASEVVDLLGQAARALDKTHAAGVVHRDLKPGNVFVSQRDDGAPWVKLLDFGIAKIALLGEEGPNNTSALGTPLYMAPEQMRSNRRLGPETDRYALAHLAYRMLTGAAFWDEERRSAESVMALLITISRGPREAATARAARRGVTLPPAFDGWFAKAAATRPHHRFDSASRMIAELATALDESVPASLVTTLPPDAPVARISSSRTTTPPGDTGRTSGSLPPDPPTADSPPEPRSASSVAESASPSVAPDAPEATAPPTSPRDATPAPSPRARRWGWAIAALAIGVAGLGLSREILRTLRARAEPAGSALTDLPSPLSRNAAAIAAYRAGLQEARDGVFLPGSFRRAIELDPELGEAHLQLAVQGIYQVDEPARAHFREALARRASLSARDRALLETIEPLLARDPSDWVEASRRAARATERFPRDAELWVVRSHIAHATSDEEAHEHASHAVALDPAYGDALANDAEALAYMGRMGEARQKLDACIEITGSAYSSCAFLQFELDAQGGDCAVMEARARRTMAGGGQLAPVHESLARALAARGAPADAVREALRAEVRAMEGPAQRRTDLAGSVRQALLGGDFASAERDARALLALVEPAPRADRHGIPSHWLALALEESGRVEEAARVALTFLDRRDGWDLDPRADDYAMSRDRTVQLLAIARAGGQLDAAEAVARRDAWLRQWTTRMLPGYRRFLWMYAFPPLAGDAAEAREALAAEAAYGSFPPFRPRTLAGAHVGHALLLAGRTDEAITRLEEATRSCRALDHPVLHTRAHDWLGLAREARGDLAGACAAYAVVIARWGHADPRSVTADHARARMSALGCTTR
jgi:serine/threonine-protein kinase